MNGMESRIKHFILFFLVATFLSNVAKGMYYIVLVWYILKLTNSSTQVGVILGISSVPGLLFLPLIGSAVDFYGGKKNAIIINIVRGSIISLTSYIILFFQGKGLQIALLYSTTLIIFTGEVLFDPAINYIIRNEFQNQEKLLRGNAFLQVTIQFGVFLSPVAAGFLISSMGEGYVFLLIGVFYILSSILFTFLKTQETCENLQNTETPNISLSISSVFELYLVFFKSCFEFIRNNRYTFLMLIVPAFEVIIAGVNTLLGPLSVSKHWSAVDFGLLDAFIAAGSLIAGFILGTILYKKLSHFFPILSIAMVSFIMITIPYLSYAFVCVAFFISGFFFTLARIVYNTEILAQMQETQIGKISSIVKMFGISFSFIITTMIGILAESLNVGIAFFSFAGFIAVITFCAIIDFKKKRAIFGSRQPVKLM
jgi:DHA3 family macrolide efflux protein-like MFS transporter